jgi:hypothetical protein
VLSGDCGMMENNYLPYSTELTPADIFSIPYSEIWSQMAKISGRQNERNL